jgi:hypothetical protein
MMFFHRFSGWGVVIKTQLGTVGGNDLRLDLFVIISGIFQIQLPQQSAGIARHCK